MTTSNILAQLGSPGVSTGFKNRIINGNMLIDQRNGGAVLTNPASSTYNVDRWYTYNTQTNKFNVQQNAGSVTPPAGFTKYVGVTGNTNYTYGAGDFFGLGQIIEGTTIQDLGWGTANAKTMTLSFWVYASSAGTYGGGLQNQPGVWFYNFSYTIPVANTWTYVSVIINAPTAGQGTWVTTNAAGMIIAWSLGNGSTYSTTTTGSWGTTFYNGYTGQPQIVGTNGAYFYLTGVQFEVGTTATNYENLEYSRQLIQCQRYYYRIKPTVNYNIYGVGSSFSTTAIRITVPYPVTLRVAPTSMDFSAANLFLAENSAGVGQTPSALADSSNSGTNAANLNVTVSGATQGIPYNLYSNANQTSYMGFSAEL